MKSPNFSVLFLFYTVQRADAYVKLQLKVETEYGREYERIDRKATYIIPLFKIMIKIIKLFASTVPVSLALSEILRRHVTSFFRFSL